jgi:histidine triad (HIT) family protein
MSESCLFCRIVRKEIPATIVFENEHVVAFRDIDPKAPTHILVVPRTHVATLDDATDARMLGEIVLAAAAIARTEGLVDGGYRTVMNCGAGAGQSVFHIHLHLLGGRKFAWPPG